MTAPAQDAILRALRVLGPSYVREIAAGAGRDEGVTGVILRRMARRGMVRRHESGLWSLTR